MALPPPSKLARYRLLGPNCGLKVSPFMLGEFVAMVWVKAEKMAAWQRTARAEAGQ